MMAVPLVPGIAVASLAVAGALRQRKQAREQEEAFYSMQWTAPPDTDSGEACVLIGEEAATDGRQWFACTEPDPSIECELVSNNPAESPEYLCKAPKVSDA